MLTLQYVLSNLSKPLNYRMNESTEIQQQQEISKNSTLCFEATLNCSENMNLFMVTQHESFLTAEIYLCVFVFKPHS